jgi:chromosome segregation protein
MRGAGMEDVVFAGTSSRNARSFAEVALQVDNSERLAPAGFNDSDLLEVTRRITRDAGSAYKVNGKDVRARDVQMLFADASTGAHSPALVRQGQISELINARPKARRSVLEEAAGISGLYQRRHEAELKLQATETNLSRVGDTVDADGPAVAGSWPDRPARPRATARSRPRSGRPRGSRSISAGAMRPARRRRCRRFWAEAVRQAAPVGARGHPGPRRPRGRRDRAATPARGRGDRRRGRAAAAGPARHARRSGGARARDRRALGKRIDQLRADAQREAGLACGCR